MPYTATEGLLTSANKGAADGGVGERTLVDYKDALGDYKASELPVMQMFAQSMTTDTGGDIDLTFALPSMKLEAIDEGSTPKYQHTKMRSERVSVKEYGIAIGVTRRMIEDSRFNEVEMALNEARKAVDRHLTDHFVKVVFGDLDALFGTIEMTISAATESAVTTFSTNPSGGWLGSGGDITADGTRVYAHANSTATNLQRSHYFKSATGALTGDTAEISINDLLIAIERIGQHGYNADTLLMSPSHYNALLQLADFTAVMTAGVGATSPSSAVLHKPSAEGTFIESTNQTRIIGSIYGLNVISNPWVPVNKLCVMDASVKPVAYVERRGLTVEEANPGFGIVGSYLSMRYGLKLVNPLSGCIIVSEA
jgi:hypothetical protein